MWLTRARQLSPLQPKATHATPRRIASHDMTLHGVPHAQKRSDADAHEDEDERGNV